MYGLRSKKLPRIKPERTWVCHVYKLFRFL